MQWLAVRIHCSEIRLPPQSKSWRPSPFRYPNATWNDDSLNTHHTLSWLRELTACGYFARFTSVPCTTEIMKSAGGGTSFPYSSQAARTFLALCSFETATDCSSLEKIDLLSRLSANYLGGDRPLIPAICILLVLQPLFSATDNRNAAL